MATCDSMDVDGHGRSDAFADGIMFDGSSIAGWKDISTSPTWPLMPDLGSTAHHGPFLRRMTTMAILFCDIDRARPRGELYERDPRGTALQGGGLSVSRSSGIGDTAYHRSRSRVLHLRRRALRFRIRTTAASSLDSDRSCPLQQRTPSHGRWATWVTGPRTEGWVFPGSARSTPDQDDLRSEMLSVMSGDGRDGRKASP